MRMYVRSELSYLSSQKAAWKKGREEQAKGGEMERLLKRHKIDPSDVEDSMREEIFGDYIDVARPKKKLGDVRKPFGMKDFATNVHPINPVSALHFLVTNADYITQGDEQRQRYSY